MDIKIRDTYRAMLQSREIPDWLIELHDRVERRLRMAGIRSLEPYQIAMLIELGPLVIAKTVDRVMERTDGPHVSMWRGTKKGTPIVFKRGGLLLGGTFERCVNRDRVSVRLKNGSVTSVKACNVQLAVDDPVEA